MFLRPKRRRKDGKVHRTLSIVESRRVRGNRVVQRQVVYLGEINDSQHASWRRTIEALGPGGARPRQGAGDRRPGGRARPGCLYGALGKSVFRDRADTEFRTLPPGRFGRPGAEFTTALLICSR